MKIRYIKEKRDSILGQSIVYKATNIKFCCNQLKNHIGKNYIGVGDCEPPSKSKELNIYECKPYPEGTFYESHEISYCPFCGEKVKYKESNQNT